MALAVGRTIFEKAYVEIRHMLEANLMRRFVATKEFDEAQAHAASSVDSAQSGAPWPGGDMSQDI